ncbi:hypothetical protein EW146_g6648 [Bondarzewia mesenterica]|uniref:Homeobox domain-containing protein n=1 Tax=Bondarzewia mesenterica TaxID=1095465 RepID=A0A4S4LNV3_9AGAM|nr:hypothetical protein EW146_g6648 [Bondarzewia mesenterica]
MAQRSMCNGELQYKKEKTTLDEFVDSETLWSKNGNLENRLLSYLACKVPPLPKLWRAYLKRGRSSTRTNNRPMTSCPGETTSVSDCAVDVPSRKAREVERKNAIAEGKMDDRLVPKRLDEAITMVGTCMDMHPRFERYRREPANNLFEWELIPGRRRVDHERAVKMYSARLETKHCLPTCARLLSSREHWTTFFMIYFDLLPREGFSPTFNFIRDRSRSMRNDFTMQHETGSLAIECHECCARFHILALQFERGRAGFSLTLEEQQLMNIMVFLVVCILKHLFVSDTIEDMENIWGGLEIPQIIDGVSTPVAYTPGTYGSSVLVIGSPATSGSGDEPLLTIKCTHLIGVVLDTTCVSSDELHASKVCTDAVGASPSILQHSMDESSIRKRLHLVEGELISGLIRGPSTLCAFNDAWSVLHRDVERAVRKRLLSDRTLSLVKVVSARVRIIIDAFIRNELESDTLLDDLVDMFDKALTGFGLCDSQQLSSLPPHEQKYQDLWHEANLDDDVPTPVSTSTAAYWWLVDNLKDPYPSSDIKSRLAHACNVSIKDLEIWFSQVRQEIVAVPAGGAVLDTSTSPMENQAVGGFPLGEEIKREVYELRDNGPFTVIDPSSPSPTAALSDHSIEDEEEDTTPPPPVAGRKRRIQTSTSEPPDQLDDTADRPIKRSRRGSFPAQTYSPALSQPLVASPSSSSGLSLALPLSLPQPYPVSISFPLDNAVWAANAPPGDISLTSRKRRLSDIGASEAPKCPRGLLRGPRAHTVSDPLPSGGVNNPVSVDDLIPPASPVSIDVSEGLSLQLDETSLGVLPPILSEPQAQTSSNRIQTSIDEIGALTNSSSSSPIAEPNALVHAPSFPTVPTIPSLPAITSATFPASDYAVLEWASQFQASLPGIGSTTDLGQLNNVLTGPSDTWIPSYIAPYSLLDDLLGSAESSQSNPFITDLSWPVNMDTDRETFEFDVGHANDDHLQAWTTFAAVD